MPLINKEIIKLIEDVQWGCGLISTRKFTEDYKECNFNTKLECIGKYGPGARVKIFWKMFEEYEYDIGYILTLPGFDSNDIWMSGIVHIPEPMGCEKQACDPEWIYLSRLLSYDNVTKIIIQGESK